MIYPSLMADRIGMVLCWVAAIVFSGVMLFLLGVACAAFTLTAQRLIAQAKDK